MRAQAFGALGGFYSFACSGASIDDVLDSIQVAGGVPIPPQLSQIPPGTPIADVTITAGIDDTFPNGRDWVDILASCFENGYRKCVSYDTVVHQEITTIGDQYSQRLLPALRALRASPTVYVTGYDNPMPTGPVRGLDELNCPIFAKLTRLHPRVLPLIEQWRQALNSALQTAADNGGARFVSLDATIPPDHRVCTDHPWVHTPHLFNIGVPNVSFSKAAFHPTAKGQQRIATAIAAATPGPSMNWSVPMLIGNGIAYRPDPRSGLVGQDNIGNLTTTWTGAGYDQFYDTVEESDLGAGASIWSDPSSLGVITAAYPTQIDEAPSGAAVISNPDAQFQPDLRLPAGTTWQPLDQPAFPSPVTNSSLRYLVDDAGDVTAVWWNPDQSGGSTVYAAYHAVGGTWTAPLPIATNCSDGIAGGLVSVENGSGDVAAVCMRIDSTTDSSILEVVTRTPDGSWSAPAVITPTGTTAEVWSPDIAIDAQGDLIVAWASQAVPVTATSSPPRLLSRYKPAGADWLPVATVPGAEPTHDSFAVAVALGATGRSTAAWLDRPQGASKAYPSASQSSAGGAWTSPQTLAPPPSGDIAGEPSVAVDANGNAAVAWAMSSDQPSAPGGEILAATKPARGNWTPPAVVSPTTDANGEVTAVGYPVQPVITPDAHVTVEWSSFEVDTGRGFVYSATSVTPFP